VLDRKVQHPFFWMKTMTSRKLKFKIVNQAKSDVLACGDIIEIEELGRAKIVMCLQASGSIIVALDMGGTMSLTLGSSAT
jgi:hypothetical protein